MKIEVVDYNRVWANEFLQIKEVLLSRITFPLKGIEHVGSTSVPGLAAKPILDIDIIIADDTTLQQRVINELAELGYIYVGDLGISGREAFKRKDEEVPYSAGKRTWMKHNLYLCREGSLGLRNHLAFRDFLRKNPDKCQSYGEIKKKLAVSFPEDIDSYIDGKTDFIVSILKQNGFAEQDRKKISTENKLK